MSDQGISHPLVPKGWGVPWDPPPFRKPLSDGILWWILHYMHHHRHFSAAEQAITMFSSCTSIDLWQVWLSHLLISQLYDIIPPVGWTWCKRCVDDPVSFWRQVLHNAYLLAGSSSGRRRICLYSKSTYIQARKSPPPKNKTKQNKKAKTTTNKQKQQQQQQITVSKWQPSDRFSFRVISIPKKKPTLFQRNISMKLGS